MSAFFKCVRMLGLSIVFAAGLYNTAHADEFLSVLPDVPLPSNMSEMIDSQMDFDSAAGRIIQVVASGNAPLNTVKEFYRVTLPQLGWAANNDDSYSRELEQLKLNYSSEGTVTIIQFELSPKANSSTN